MLRVGVEILKWSLHCDAINNRPDSEQGKQMDHSLNYKFSDKSGL